jgi:DNA-binding NarL/FixJ family response regulator
MELKAILLSSNEKIVRVLRRTLSDLEIDIEHCPKAEIALRKLTRKKFEAIIVDCADPGASDVLRSVRSAGGNKRAIAVAILDPGVGMRSAFDLGAHFILYKPISAERSKSSFRAARALMKKERRRNVRLAIRIPLEMSNAQTGAQFKVTTIDLGEGGVAVSMPHRKKLNGCWQLKFTLPGDGPSFDLAAQFAWEGAARQIGLRFDNPSPEVVRELRVWVEKNSPDVQKYDPPVVCRVTDLTLGGCYLENSSPFPVSTLLTLSMRAGGMELTTDGVVRVMHADHGMGVEFIQTAKEQKRTLERFLGVLAEHPNVAPEVTVEPEGLEVEAVSASTPASAEDALVALFRAQAGLPTEAFLQELRKQRGVDATASV